MSKPTTDREMMDLIFSGFHDASRIVINYHRGNDFDIFIGDIPLEIETVNGCKSPKMFRKQMMCAGKKLIDQALEMQAGLNPEESSAFLKDVAANIDSLILSTLQVKTDQVKNDHDEDESGQRWLFTTFTTNLSQTDPIPEMDEASIRSFSWQYARAWHKALKKTRKEIRRLASLIRWIQVRAETEPKPDLELRIPVNSNIERLAFLARVFYEKKSFGTSNKSQLCIDLCRSFTTTHRDILSPASFKNKFDCPGKDAMAYWRREFGGLLKKTCDLEKQYS